MLSQAVSGVSPATPSPTGSVITFDARGAVTPQNVNVFYLASGIAPERVIERCLLMPAGSIQIWTADASGYWQQVRWKQIDMKRRSNSRYTEHGFTLTEMLIATAIILVGLVAVAQLVPASVMLNSNNRSNATALVLAQRQLEAMREVSLNTTTFNDPLGVLCPLSTTCYLAIPPSRGKIVGSSCCSRQLQHAGDRFFASHPLMATASLTLTPTIPFGRDQRRSLGRSSRSRTR